jgi:hypothetical protein
MMEVRIWAGRTHTIPCRWPHLLPWWFPIARITWRVDGTRWHNVQCCTRHLRAASHYADGWDCGAVLPTDRKTRAYLESLNEADGNWDEADGG